MARYNFKFGDTWISEFGAVCTQEPSVEIAQRDISLVDIPGRDGSDCIDNGRYMNVEFSRTIALVSRKGSSADEKAALLVNAMAYLQGYQDFEDTHHNGLICEAVLTNFEEIAHDLRTMQTATLKFSRKPYWYLKDAMQEQDIGYSTANTDGTDITLVNPYPSTACPTIIIEVNTSSYSADFTYTFEFSISSEYDGEYSTKEYTLSKVEGNYDYRFIEVDIENQRVFSRSEEGERLTFCDCTVPEPIGTGDTLFHFNRSSNIKSIKIKPNWRCL